MPECGTGDGEGEGESEGVGKGDGTGLTVVDARVGSLMMVIEEDGFEYMRV